MEIRPPSYTERIATKRREERTVANYGEERRHVYYYHGDHLGSAQVVTDYRGDVYEHIEYTPYGELWVEHAPDVEATPFRFTGKERDSETGLYYYGARYLNPQTGMWLSTDPAMGEYIPQAPMNDEAKKYNGNLPGMGGVFNTVNLHVYHYAGNNPVKYIDPDGLSPRPLTLHEQEYVFEILGTYLFDRGIKVDNFGSNGSISLPWSNIYIDNSRLPPLDNARNKGNFIHEIFHQYQYSKHPVRAAVGLFFEMISNEIVRKITPPEKKVGYSIDNTSYRLGDYRHANALLNSYQTLDDIPKEAQAELVGNFAELYSLLKDGRNLNDRQANAIRQSARIMKNSGINSYAVEYVNEYKWE
jgi:RHS repeat-associated protein